MPANPNLKAIFVLPVTALMSVIFGCSHYYYVPTVQNVPLFREKNEFRISGSIGTGEQTTCFEAQCAYSISGNFAAMTNFLSATGIENNEESNGRGTYIDAALGYYRPLWERGVFEVYGGGGLGNQKHQYRNDEYHQSISSAGTSRESFGRFFIQPSIGLRFNFLEIAFSTRFNRLSFYNIENNIDGNLNNWELQVLEQIEKTRNYLFLEPALTIRAGWKNVKLQVQGSTASYLNNSHYPFDQYQLSIGLNVNISGI